MSTAEPSAAPPDTRRQRVDRIVNGLLVIGLVVFGLGVLLQLIFSTSSVGQYGPFPGLALLVLTFPYALGNGTIRGPWIQRLCGAGGGFLFVGLIGYFAMGFEYWSMRWPLFMGTLLLVWGIATGFISGEFYIGGRELDQWRRPVKLHLFWIAIGLLAFGASLLIFSLLGHSVALVDRAAQPWLGWIGSSVLVAAVVVQIRALGPRWLARVLFWVSGLLLGGACLLWREESSWRWVTWAGLVLFGTWVVACWWWRAWRETAAAAKVPEDSQPAPTEPATADGNDGDPPNRVSQPEYLFSWLFAYPLLVLQIVLLWYISWGGFGDGLGLPDLVWGDRGWMQFWAGLAVSMLFCNALFVRAVLDRRQGITPPSGRWIADGLQWLKAQSPQWLHGLIDQLEALRAHVSQWTLFWFVRETGPAPTVGGEPRRLCVWGLIVGLFSAVVGLEEFTPMGVGVVGGAAFGLLALMWYLTAGRRAQTDAARALRRGLCGSALCAAGALVVVPMLVWLVGNEYRWWIFVPAVLIACGLIVVWIWSVDRARVQPETAPQFVHANEIRRVGSFLLWTWFFALAIFYFPKLLAGTGFPGDKWLRTETGWMPIGLLAGVAVTLVIVAVYEFWWREQWHGSRFLNSLPGFRNTPPETDPYRGLHALAGVLTALIPLGALAVFLVEHLYFDAVWSPVWLVCLFLALFNSAYGFVAFHFAGLQYVSALLIVLILAVANIGHEYKMTLPGVDDYYAEGRRPDLDGPVPELPKTLTLIDTKQLLATNSANWNATRDNRKGAGYDPPKPRLVIIATTGGGIQASVWTSLVMDALQNHPDLKPFEIHKQIRLITGASGGMQGAGLHVADFGNPRPNQPRLDEQLARDSLWPTLQTMLTHDLPGALVPKRFDNDRGKQLEAAWRENTPATDWKRDVPNWVRSLHTPPPGTNSPVPPLDLTFAKLKEKEEKCERPVLVFSPMLVEDCRRVMISNLSLDWFTKTTARHQNKELTFPNVTDPNTISVPALEFWRYFPDAHSKFRVSTAARMSASFPFVGPAVSLPTNPPRRVVDAGYFDNFGINFVAMWLHHHKKEICEHTSGVVIVEIRAYPRREEKLRYKVTQPDGTLDEGGYTWALSEFSSPLEAIYNLYARSAYFRNDQLLHMLDESFNGRDPLPKGTRPFFTIATFECPQPAALSWTLPERNYNELLAIVHGTQMLRGASQKTKDRIEKTREQVEGARDGLRHWFAGETLPPKP